jgi:hypothetical protein
MSAVISKKRPLKLLPPPNFVGELFPVGIRLNLVRVGLRSAAFPSPCLLRYGEQDGQKPKVFSHHCLNYFDVVSLFKKV